MTKRQQLDEEHFKDLLHQALETELGGVRVYEKALECVINDDLREEWSRYLDETREHVAKLRDVFERFGFDENETTPTRKVVKHIGESLVKAMDLALNTAELEAAELVACECVVHAETK